MDHELADAITVLAGRLADLAARDEKLRDALRRLLSAILEEAEEPPAPPAEGPERQDVGVEERNGREEDHSGQDESPAPAEAPPAPAVEAAAPPAEPRAPLPELTLGRSRPPTSDRRAEVSWPSPFARSATLDDDMEAVEANCRLKAEGVRWAVERRRLLDQGADFQLEIAPGDSEIIARARELEGCYLWMNTAEFSAVPRDPAALKTTAGWFEAVADAVALARKTAPGFESDREHIAPILNLLAEAQSALRMAVERIHWQSDPDQYRAYDWLRGATVREQIYIARHMKLDDPADPAVLPDFQKRINALSTRIQAVRGRSKQQRKAIGKLRYHAKQIVQEKSGLADWRKIEEAIDELLDAGAPPSNVEARDALLPILDAMPEGEEFSRGFNLVLREIDRYLASRPSPIDPTTADAPNPEVAEAAELLRGKRVLLIGGHRRADADQKLRAAFGLEDLIWFETKEHESISVFEHHIARPEVALVLLAIRWSSHSFGGVKQFCDQHGKPIVRLPGGYGVNQVAAQVLAQVSGRLTAD